MSEQQLVAVWLQGFRSNDALFQLGQNWRLTNELEVLAKDLPGMKHLLFCVRRHAGFDGRGNQQLSPDQVLSFCETIGMYTIGAVNQWCAGHAGLKPEALQASILQSISLPNYSAYPPITPQQILDAINDQCDVRELLYEFEDVDYRMPSLGDVAIITQKCPVRYRDYKPEKFDCDDFARGVKQWLAENGYGSIPLGRVAVVVESKTGEAVLSHKLCVFITAGTDGSPIVRFFEGQTGRIFAPREYGDRGILGGAWRYVITRVLI